MRHKIKTKVEKSRLKYAILNKKTNEITIYRFKTKVADLIGVSTRTLDRTIPYENDNYCVYLVCNVVL